MDRIVLMTDFGLKDGYVGIMKGVIRSINQKVEILDLTHEISPQNLKAASFILWNSYKYFPEKTIFLNVVDPGVGSERDILLVQSEKYLFICPDNGLLDYILAELPVKLILKLEHPEFLSGKASHTFHGRDIFAPLAARIAGGFPITQAGPTISYQIPESPFVSPIGSGQQKIRILHVDHFGNMISNVKGPFEDREELMLNAEKVSFVKSYFEGKENEFIALEGSHGLLEFAIKNGHAANAMGLNVDEEARLTWQG